MAYPWCEDGEVVRVKVERMGEASQRQVALEPADGSSGLFGWNTIASNAKEVSHLTLTYPCLSVLCLCVCVFVGGYRRCRVRCCGSPPGDSGTGCGSSQREALSSSRGIARSEHVGMSVSTLSVLIGATAAGAV